jgi:hypothetical protein
METTGFIEKNCTIEHEGKTSESGGSYLLPCTDGKWRGVVYGWGEKKGIVTDWHGNEIAKAHYGRIYQGNFCKMQSVSFQWGGHHFFGRYCPDWSQAVKVRANK